MSTPSAFCQRLGLEHPIVLGPFGGNLSSIGLSALVANRGGLGSYGAHMVGPDALLTLNRDLAAATNRAYALNLWVSTFDPGGISLTEEQFDEAFALFAPYFTEIGVPKPARPAQFNTDFDQQVDALLEARPPVFSFVFGIPSPKILAECRRLGIVTLGAATTIAEAKALEAAGVDALVATGFEAGGHRPAFLAQPEDNLMGTFALVPMIRDQVAIPVVAAGGIVDRRGVAAALMLGAEAVQVGTAFLACAESGTTDAHRQALFSDQAHHTRLTRTFSGRLARGLMNRWVEEMLPPKARALPYPIQNWFVSKLRPVVVEAGRTDLVSLWSSQAAPLLRHHTADAVMDELVEGLDRART